MDGEAYAKRIADLAATGVPMHGEADLVSELVPVGSRILDAGCGTGRVGIELARRGYDVVGVDRDPSMLAQAQGFPGVEWQLADLTDFDGGVFDLVLMAGNVMIFTEPGTESAVVARMARSVKAGGLVVAGFQLGRLDVETYDTYCGDAGLKLESRFATWEGAPFRAGEYAVSIHRLAIGPFGGGAPRQAG